MSRSYAIAWQEPIGPLRSGKLELRASGLRLEGRNGTGPVATLIPYDELLDLRAAPWQERLGGRPTLVLGRRGAGDIRLASVGAPGVISEIVDQVGAMKTGTANTAERVAVVVPLRKGKRDKAERLLDQGPPFDPAKMGLESHEVFLSDDEAVFVFNAPPGFSIQKLLADSRVWASAASWHDVIGGTPRIARPFFAWEAVTPRDDLFFEPTPGPGDSEGGDIYSP